MHDDMKERQAKENAFVKKLTGEGHTCISIMESYPSKTSWCEQTPCINSKKDPMYDDMEERQAEEDALVKKLESEGHTCISILQSYPTQMNWREQTPCKNLKDDSL